MKNFVPKPYKKVPITFRIDSEKLDKVDELSLLFDLSRSNFINHCIDFALENIKFEPKESPYNR